MSAAHEKTPAAGGPRGAFKCEKTRRQKHAGIAGKTKPVAPYGNRLDNGQRTIFVATGSEAWAWGGNNGRSGHALVLPPGGDPEAFAWPLNGRDCIVIVRGESEPREVVMRLCRELIASGAPRVCWLNGERPFPLFKSRKAAS
jgi:hypothetical protein